MTTRIISEFEAEVEIDGDADVRRAQKLNQFISEKITDRSFESVCYEFVQDGEHAYIEASFASSKSYKQEKHVEALRAMTEEVAESPFSEFETEQEIEVTTAGEEDEDEE